jgi:ABC-2 type transport system ATP-binding protein
VLVSSHVLAEVAQTVDHVLIVNRGRLVVESPLAELTARIGGGVRVRSPQSDELRRALAARGIESVASGDGQLLVQGAASEQVGEVAAAAGVVLHELSAASSSLEEVFLELTGKGAA